MKDSVLYRATGANGMIAIVCVDSTKVVKQMQETHQSTPVATAALGRLTTGALLMASQLKNDSDTITLQIKGDGAVGSMIAIAKPSGEVKSYAQNPKIEMMEKNNKLDVGRAVGKGELIVMRDLGLKEPYIGTTALVTGEIAEDITAYYALSEQIPSAVALGVLVDVDFSVLYAGGFMVQLLPGATADVIDALEAHLSNLPAVTAMLRNGVSALDILNKVMEPFSLDGEVTGTTVFYDCDCSAERMEKALISLGKEEILKLKEDLDVVEMSCQFCNRKHEITKERLEQILQELE